MKDEEMKTLIKSIAEFYEMDFETARALFIKIANVIYEEKE